MKSQTKQPVIDEMSKLTESKNYDKLEFIKNPMIAAEIKYPHNFEILTINLNGERL